MFGVNPTTQFRKNNQHRHFKKYNVENDGRLLTKPVTIFRSRNNRHRTLILAINDF